MLRRLKGRTALVHTVHNADAYHANAGVQGRGYRGLLDMFDALIVHGGTTREALERQGVDPKRIHVIPHPPMRLAPAGAEDLAQVPDAILPRSEEHTSELQSIMRSSYADFCLKKQNIQKKH